MGKAHKAIKRRKQKKSTAPSKSKTPGGSFTKWILLFAAIPCAAVIIGILSYTGRHEKTPEQPLTPSVKREEPSPPKPKLTQQQEIAALKQEEMELAGLVIKDFPDAEAALEMMGNLHSRNGRKEQAAQFWQRCLDKNPRRLSIYSSRGTVAIDAGEFEQAVEHLKKAIEINPKTPAIHEKLGHALVELGRYDQAIAELQAELSIIPGSPVTHFLLGQAYLKQKDYEKAQSHYQKALKLNPKYANACYGLARAFAKIEQPEKAKEYQAKFRTIRAQENQSVYENRETRAVADLTAARESLAQTLLDAENLYRTARDFRKSELLLQRLVAVDPNNSKGFEKLGSLYNMTNRLPQAIRQFERMSRIDPSNIYCYLNIGKISIRLKQYDNAESAYQRAISAAPKKSLGYRELARLYLTQRTKFTQARQLAQKAVTIEASAENFFILSWASDVNGDHTQASKAIKEALRLDPKNPKYRQINERIKSGK